MAKKEKEGNEDVIYVNAEKLLRAKDILLLVSGKRTPRNGTEQEIKEHWSGILADGGVKPADEEAERFVYEKLGGLVRTKKEEEEHEEVVEEMQKKNRSRKIEADK